MTELLQPIETVLVLGGILLFTIGYTLAPLIYHKEIRWLLAFPLWVAAKLEKWSQKQISFPVLLVFIFTVNSLSLLADFYSGKITGLPLVFAIWTGINIGVVTFHTLKGKFYFSALFNPVALLELPAVFITFALALRMNLLGLDPTIFAPLPFEQSLNTFTRLVLPLLGLAAVIEAALIRLAQRFQE